MEPWFTVEEVGPATYAISEYRHWEETHAYLLLGEKRALLLDTGLGIGNISRPVARLTSLPVTAVATHVHWDHIGGHWHYPDFYVHREELPWITGGFPQPLSAVRGFVAERCSLPEGFDPASYQIFQGTPTRVLEGGEALDLGGRSVKVLHTPGHSPGHMCFWEEATGFLFTGDLVYLDTLFAWFPSTDPGAYLRSLELVGALPVSKVLPGHHSLQVEPRLVTQVRDFFRQLKQEGKLHHGSGTFSCGQWGVRL